MRTIVSAGLVVMTAQLALADHSEIEEVLVLAERDLKIYELAESPGITPDSGSILRRVVGANLVTNGPLTGIAQYRGMSRFRVSTQINGEQLSSGGPNWMDSPLSYAPAAHLESLQVYRGIAPVSAGAETIGGAIKAQTWQGDFAEQEVVLKGQIQLGAQTVDAGELASVALIAASERHLLKMSALAETGDDAEFSDGDILPTEYERDRFDIGYGFRSGAHTFRLDFGRSMTGDTGTPALPMDIQYIDADLASVSWNFAGDSFTLQGKLYSHDIEHGMSNYHLRPAPMAVSMWRRNLASGDNRGFALSVNWEGWRFGIDGLSELHNSDIDNPNNPAFFITNFHDAQRELLGLFVERHAAFGQNWLVELGARFKRVNMDSDQVNATPAVMGMPPAVVLRDAFNSSDRSTTDYNTDWVLKLNYAPNSIGQGLDRGLTDMSYYAGLSRKTRAPAYQERYLWLPLQATAGLADGRTYIGDLRLNAEVAHEVELGFDWQSRRFSASPRVFYRSVNDYIQGTATENRAAIMFVQMMNAMNGTNNAAPLQFSNVDADFYGMDVDWRYTINEKWSLNGVLNYVRGRRDDVRDNLYRVAPTNGFIALNYKQERWGLSVESFWYDAQNHVSETNSETRSSGYSLFNFHGHTAIGRALKLSFGIDNLTDKRYAAHLGGVNRVNGNPDVAPGVRLPGYGRNAFARVDLRW